MYPMDFNEYLYNRNRTLYNYLSDSFNSENKVLDNEMHNMAMSYVFEYMLVGGMPEIVDIYIKTNSYPRAKQNLMVLYNDYLNDMSLFQISQETIMRTKNVFNNVFKELNKENKNFKISEIEKGKRFRDYMYPLDWLSVGNIIYKSNQLKEKVTYPLANDEDSLFRIYLSDLGYFSLQSGLGAENFLTDLKSNTLSGIFFENFVACELKTRGFNLFYWKGKSTSELEFVIQLDGKIISIDAKKNKGSLDSLYKYRETNKNELAIKVSQNKYGYNEDNKLLTLPFYYLGFYLDSKKQ
jgi:predicted AAA+ superfamily ATPase